MNQLNQHLAILTLAGFLTFSTNLQAQNVYIPDANFKAALVSCSAIYTYGDREIQKSETLVYNEIIDVRQRNISEFSGIETFVNNTKL